MTNQVGGSRIAELKQDAKNDASRDKLIDAALELFSSKGFDGVTTRDIAQAAGLNISLISYYFSGKEGLYNAVINKYVEESRKKLDTFISEIEKREFTKENFHMIMRQLMQGMLYMKSATPQVSRLWMREALSGMPHSHEIFEKITDECGSKVVEFLVRAQKKGYLRQDLNCQFLFVMMVNATEAYVITSTCPISFMKSYQLPKELNSYIDQTFKIFIEGVAYEEKK